MADYTVTAANVLQSAGATVLTITAAVAITAGQTLYKDGSGNANLADANGVSPAFNLLGISVSGAAAGQTVCYVVGDPSLAAGITVAAGATVCLSATPGALCPDADVVSGYYKTIIGVGIGGNKIKFAPLAAGVVT